MKRFICAMIVLILSSPLGIYNGKAMSPYRYKIMFSKDDRAAQNIYIMGDDGTNKVRVSGEGGYSPIISYDGKLMVYRIGSYRQHENIFVDFKKKEITRILDSNAYIHSISPNNDSVLYTRYADADKYDKRQLYISDIDGSNETKLISGADIWEASFSPAGDKVAYIKEGYLFVLDLSTQEHIQMTNKAPCDSISWSSDGNKIFCCGPNYEIMSITEDDKNTEVIFHDDEILSTKPQISPDSKYIVFLNEKDRQIYRVKSDGTSLTKLTESMAADHPVWIKAVDNRNYQVQDDMIIPSLLD
ncbi:DUF5050 domain-containing protein [Petroclostridium sp. X23]|uniref:TolB family protein n=1 Tax=Petroclostridium sp. X23 TaxID=3045146 RepID=UPI0024AD6248|nr:DUF5050 domain-containing protein [Petroclostridium sp. X23]WHH57009.1 DUF5050 domain-containing protein [Petroclostridium sp. X23]